MFLFFQGRPLQERLDSGEWPLMPERHVVNLVPAAPETGSQRTQLSLISLAVDRIDRGRRRDGSDGTCGRAIAKEEDAVHQESGAVRGMSRQREDLDGCAVQVQSLSVGQPACNGDPVNGVRPF